MLFRKRKDSNVDFGSLNDILFTGKKIVRIFYVMTIIALILLGTYLIKEWHALKIIGEFIAVISPIFIGLIIAWLLDPFVKFLQGKKVPRILACIFAYLLFIAVLSLIIVLLIPALGSQVKDFIGNIPGLVSEFKGFLNGVVIDLNNAFDYDFTSLINQLYHSIETFGVSLSTRIPEMAINFFTSLFNGGVSFFLGLMIGFYMLFDFDKLSRNFLNFLPKRFRGGATELVVRLNDSLRSYVQGVLLVMTLVFITQAIGLTLSGLQAPLVFAFFCALTDIIPYFGPYIGAIPIVIVGFMMDPVVGICCVISIVVVQLLENNFYQPLIMGHTMKLHPVTIMIGLLIFQHFFGIIGMIVATPVIAALKIILTFINEKIDVYGKVIGEEEKELEVSKT